MRFVSEIILAMFGCSRIVLTFATTQSEHNFHLRRHKALKALKVIRFSQRLVVAAWIHRLFWFICC